VILTPHLAASPLDDLRHLEEVIEYIGIFAKGNDGFKNVMDPNKNTD